MNRKLQILHDIVEVIVLVIIAGAVFTIGIVDFKVLGGSRAIILTAAQVVVCLTCIPGGYMVKKGIDSLFEWVEERIVEEMEEG